MMLMRVIESAGPTMFRHESNHKGTPLSSTISIVLERYFYKAFENIKEFKRRKRSRDRDALRLRISAAVLRFKQKVLFYTVCIQIQYR